FDHLGWGTDASMYRKKAPMIHYGADDNASGTSGMMELAARIAAKPLKRSVIFIGFNAEEIGLLGSNYYVKHPFVPIEKTVFMLNMDMIGRMRDNKLNILGTGTSSKFALIADSLAKVDSLSLLQVTEAFAPSDQSSFYSVNIPSVMLFSGVHGDYHKPTDTWDKINFPGIIKIVDYCEQFIRTIGDAPLKPDLIKLAKADTTQKTGHGGYGAWFGIVPNFESNPDGFKISGVTAGSPAQTVGLQTGDIITKFGEKVVKSLYDLTFALKEKRPGEVVKVTYLRKGKEYTVDCKLTKRGE
ncbi:MAG: M28 family peptidase, partial [Bacteroidota bacterium]